MDQEIRSLTTEISQQALVASREQIAALLAKHAPIQLEVHLVKMAKAKPCVITASVDGRFICALHDQTSCFIHDRNDPGKMWRPLLNGEACAILPHEGSGFRILHVDGAVWEVDPIHQRGQPCGMVDYPGLKEAKGIFPAGPQTVLLHESESRLTAVNHQQRQVVGQTEVDGGIHQLSVDGSGRHLLTVSKDQLRVTLWRTAPLQPVTSLKVDLPVQSHSMSSDGNWIALGNQERVTAYEIGPERLHLHRTYELSDTRGLVLAAVASREAQDGMMADNVRSILGEEAEDMLKSANCMVDTVGNAYLSLGKSRSDTLFIIHLGEKRLTSLVDSKRNLGRNSESSLILFWRIPIRSIKGNTTIPCTARNEHLRIERNGIRLFDLHGMKEMNFLAPESTLPMDQVFGPRRSKGSAANLFSFEVQGNATYCRNIDVKHCTTRRFPLPVHSGRICVVAADGKSLAVENNQRVITGDNNHELILIDTGDGSLRNSGQCDDWILAATFDSRGQVLTGCDFSVPELTDAGKLIRWNGMNNWFGREWSRSLSAPIDQIIVADNGSVIVHLIEGEKKSEAGGSPYLFFPRGMEKEGKTTDQAINRFPDLFLTLRKNESANTEMVGIVRAVDESSGLVCLERKDNGNTLVSLWRMGQKRLDRIWEVAKPEKMTQILALHSSGRLIAVVDGETVDIDLPEERQYHSYATSSPPKHAAIIDGERLLALCIGERVDFFDLARGIHLASYHPLLNGFVWTTSADRAAANGWLWTDRPDLITLHQEREGDGQSTPIPPHDPRFAAYMKVFNNHRMVRLRLNDWDEYERQLALWGRAVQREVGHIPTSVTRQITSST